MKDDRPNKQERAHDATENTEFPSVIAALLYFFHFSVTPLLFRMQLMPEHACLAGMIGLLIRIECLRSCGVIRHLDLRLLIQHIIPQNQCIHLGSQKTTKCVFG